MVFPVLLALLLVPLLALAHPAPHADGPGCTTERGLPSTWYHEPGHPVERLFKRQNGGGPNDGVTYPQIGTPAWSAGFPSGNPDVTKMPQEWTSALNAAVAAGLIPNIPASRYSGNNLIYPQGVNPNGQQVCSASYGCRGPNDIWDAPDGVLAISFDDGPTAGSAKLYDYLKETQTRTTHFMIGSNIKSNPDLFDRAFSELKTDIAVHTWSHRYMTTLSNLELVAEFGWTMEIIKNSTGGRLPRYWRPPYGDADNRVRAVAKEVFGLQTVIWNKDTVDWSIVSGGTTLQAINASMTKWLHGPKSPGLMILEHELDAQTVQAFINAYPTMISTGWKLESVAAINGNAYINSQDDNSPVERANGVLLQTLTPPASSTSSSTTSSTPGEPTGGTNNAGNNTSQSGKNGSIQSTMPKFAGALVVIFLTVLFYAW